MGTDLSDVEYYDTGNNWIQGITMAGSPPDEAKDCAVRALAIVADIPYSVAYELLFYCGRHPNSACPNWYGDNGVMATLPFKFKRLVRKPIRLDTFCKRFPTGRYILQIRDNHVTSVIEGIVHDLIFMSPKSIVKAAWTTYGLKKGV
jgi:hypothetical protein